MAMTKVHVSSTTVPNTANASDNKGEYIPLGAKTDLHSNATKSAKAEKLNDRLPQGVLAILADNGHR